MQLEESLNNRAWPDQDALSAPYPSASLSTSPAAVHESANNAAANGGAGGGWLLGLRSFLPLAGYGSPVGPPAADAQQCAQPGTHAAVSQAATLQGLPGGELIMQLPADSTRWPAAGGTSAMDTDPPPPRQTESALDWSIQLGAGVGADPMAQPTSGGPDPGGGGTTSGEKARMHGADRGIAGSFQQRTALLGTRSGKTQQLSDEVEEATDVRGGSGGDGSLVSSATAMQDSADGRASPLLLAPNSWGVLTAPDHLQPAQLARPSLAGEPSGSFFLSSSNDFAFKSTFSDCSCAHR